MIVSLIAAVVWLLNLSICAAQDRPVRNTTAGLVAGYFHTEGDAVAEIFEGVPYAQPPVGHLRFELPAPVKPWEDELDAGPGSMPWCVQFWYPDKRLDVRKWKEDCLYSIITVPHNHSSKALKKPYPVLFWIHGGSYQVNGANMYPINGTVKNLVSEGMVVVSINYRLGPLGFLSALHPELPGNLGLEDMILALKWLKENAAFFDADPNRITVGGESAGAASVSLLASSPRAKGLFHRIILRSGGALAPWAVRSKNTDLNSLLMIRWCGCGELFDAEHGVRDVKRCMKSIPVSRLLEIWQIIGNQDLLYVISGKKQPPHNYNHPFLAHTYFTPVVDSFRLNESIIPSYPYDMIRQNAHVPAMIGVTTGECSAYVTWLHFLVSVKQKDVDVNLNDLEFVVPSVMYSNAEQVKQAVYKRYIGDHIWQPGFDFGKTLVSIASDQNFIAPAVQEARLYAQNNQSVYAYIFDHRNEELEKKQLGYGLEDVGTGHGHDMVYLFESTSVVDPIGVSLNWTNKDRQITNYLKMSTFNFSAFGKPSGMSKAKDVWPKYEGENGQAMTIDADIRASGFFERVASFWQETVPTIESLTLYRGYQYFPSPPCTDTCRGIAHNVDYRLPFFVLLGCSALLILAFTVTICLSSQRRKESSYSLSVPLT